MPSEQPTRGAAPLPGCAVLPPIDPAASGAKREAERVSNLFGRSTKSGPQTGRGSRFALLNAFADYGMAGLTGAQVKVWLALFRDTKSNTGTARTGQADLARRAGVNVRTVRRALLVLERKGLFQVVRRGRLETGASVYRVLAKPP